MKKTGRKLYGEYPDEQAVIEVIRLKARKRKGAERPLGPWEIARELNAEGYVSQVGRPWSGIQVKRILARENGETTMKRPGRSQKEHLDSTDYLMRQEVAACRAVLRDSDRAIFETLLGAGLRAGELCALEVCNLGLYRGRSQIDVKKTVGKDRTKTGRTRAVKIGPRLKRLLRQYLLTRKTAGRHDRVFLNQEGRGLSYHNLYDLICRIRDRAGVMHLHPHALRHTFGSVLYHYKKDLEYVRKQLGHKSIATTQIYVNVFSESELEQMAGFERYFDQDKSVNTLQVK